jgi:hypothetical protein
VQFNVTFTTPFSLAGGDHIFFRPEVDLGSAGDFLWLSAPKPIVAPGTPFMPDLQSWIRNDGAGAIGPDWSRIGTDITNQGPFNASFSLSGTTTAATGVPLPPGATSAIAALLLLAAWSWRRRAVLGN